MHQGGLYILARHGFNHTATFGQQLAVAFTGFIQVALAHQLTYTFDAGGQLLHVGFSLLAVGIQQGI